jgi:hypothetical protein
MSFLSFDFLNNDDLIEWLKIQKPGVFSNDLDFYRASNSITSSRATADPAAA